MPHSLFLPKRRPRSRSSVQVLRPEKTLCIAGDRVCSSAFGCTVQQSCRRIGAISAVVGKGSAVKHGVRAGDYIDAAEDICGMLRVWLNILGIPLM